MYQVCLTFIIRDGARKVAPGLRPRYGAGSNGLIFLLTILYIVVQLKKSSQRKLAKVYFALSLYSLLYVKVS